MVDRLMVWDRRPEYMFRKRGIAEVYQEYVYKLMKYNNIQDVNVNMKFPLRVYEESDNSIMEFSTGKTKNYAISINIPRGYKLVRFRIDTNFIIDTLSRLDNARLCEYGTKNDLELKKQFDKADKNTYKTYDDYVIQKYIRAFNNSNKDKHLSGYRKLITEGDIIYVGSRIRCNTYIEYTLLDSDCINSIDI